VGIQEVRRERGGTEPAGEYTFFYGKGNENHALNAGSFLRKGIISAYKTVEFVSDRMSYICHICHILRGRRCHVIILNVHAPVEDKVDVEDTFYEELEHVYD
jgi:hypothetical protein